MLQQDQYTMHFPKYKELNPQKTTNCAISFLWHLGKGKTTGMENRLAIASIGSGEGVTAKGQYMRIFGVYQSGNDRHKNLCFC